VILQSSITSATEPAGASTSPGLMESMANLPPAEIERRLPNEPPFNYYGYAGRWRERQSRLLDVRRPIAIPVPPHDGA
jgi:hypothetical protein